MSKAKPSPAVSNKVGSVSRGQVVGTQTAKTINNYSGAGDRPKPKPTDTQLLAAFAKALQPVAEKCAELVTSGIELGTSKGDMALRLAQVYVGLDTTTPRPTEERPRREVEAPDQPRNLSALEALLPLNPGSGTGVSPVRTGTHGRDARATTDAPVQGFKARNSFRPNLPPKPARVVLVGEPGSGKSTFLQYVTLCLADQLRTACRLPSLLGDHDVPPLLRQRKLVPLRLLLREFATKLGKDDPGTTEHVLEALRENLPEEAARNLPALLKRGLALVLFDGLDEVPQPLIPRVKEAIQHFSRTDYPDCPVALTCRVASYERPEFTLEGFPRPHVIAALSRDQQTKFVQAWYAELETAQKQFQGKGKDCADSLLQAITSEDLSEMAGNPFFLTAMAALHRPDKPLPNVSARLMDALVKSVLEESRKCGSGTPKSPTPELGTLLAGIDNGLDVLRRRLQLIAYEARADRHQRHDASSRQVHENLLQAKLALNKNVTGAWVDQLIEALRHRAGLLQCPRPDQFEFAYRFEEFLAGCHLANRNVWSGDDANFVRRARRLLQEQKDYARKVVQWAAGMFAHVNPDQSAVKDLVAALTPAAPRLNNLPDLMLAAEIAKDARMAGWQDDDVPHTGRTLADLRARLDTVSQAADGFPIKPRAAAASARGHLGELPAGVGVGSNGLPAIEWLDLPGGEIELREKRGKKWRVPAFRLSQYPVTVEQFRAFLDDPQGYHYEQWWKDEPDASGMTDWWRKNHAQGPENYDPIFQTPNHPRVGVCWYEATAFCRWLTARLNAGRAALPRRSECEGDADLAGALLDCGGKRSATPLSEDEASGGESGVALRLPPQSILQVRLPHEAEWELAARWNKDGKKADNRYFPWAGSKEGDDQALLNERCNWHGTGLGHTSAVGLFPDGKADCGALDLSGNVWEWCENWYDKDQDRRVLRGGSWGGNDPAYLSCSCRGGDPPVGRDGGNGFRCVWCVGGSAPR